MNDKLTKVIGLIKEGLQYSETHPDKDGDDYGVDKVELYEETIRSAGLSREDIDGIFRNLRKTGVIKLQQIFYAPDRTVSNYETDTKYKVPADDFYKNPVYVLHINRKKLESVPSVGAVRFVDNEAIIYFGAAKIELPPHRGEHVFCKVMFGHQINEPVSWDVVFEEVTGKRLTAVDKETDKRAKRKIYDISEAINKRIKDVTGTGEMFVWQGTTIKRTR